MNKRNFISMAFAVLCIQLAAVTAIHADDASKVFSEALQAQDEQEAIGRERSEALHELNSEMSNVVQQKHALKQPPPDAERIEKMTKGIEMLEQQLERQKAQLKIAKVSDPDERKKLVTEYEEREKKLRDEIQEKNKPYLEKSRLLSERYRHLKEPLEELAKSFTKKPTGEFSELTLKRVTPYPTSGNFNIKWYGSDDKGYVWGVVRLNKEPKPRENAKLLNDKFPIHHSSRHSVSVWAGHFLVTMQALTDDARDEAKLRKLIEVLFDLDKMAAVKVE